MKDRIDPLYTIFEQHLYNFEDEEQDRKTFIASVLKDYLDYLMKMNIVIPKSLESAVVDELAIQVNTMLVKKIYGCPSIQDFQSQITAPAKRRARSRYTQLSRIARSSRSPLRRAAG